MTRKKKSELKLRTAYYEEEHKEGCRPLVCLAHKLFGKITHIAEYCTEHHTYEQGRKADMNVTYIELELRKSNRHNNSRDSERKSLAVGMEESFRKGKEHSHYRAENERKHDLEHGIHKDIDDAESACGSCHSLCDTEGYREDNKTNRVVKSNNGKQHIGKLTLCLVLTDNHQGCGRCCC